MPAPRRRMDEAEAVKSTAAGLAARGIFVAGFAFLELSRFASVPDGAASTIYVVFMSAAFVLGAAAAAVCVPQAHYLVLLKPGSQRDTFAEGVKAWVTGWAGSCLLVALLCYSVAMCAAGPAYFPADDAGQWVTTIVMGIASILAMGGVAWACIAAARPGAGADTPAAGVVAGGEEPHEPTEAYRGRQAVVLADRATFLVGFAQAGIIRYNAKASSVSEVSIVFLLAASLACGAALVAAVLATALETRMAALPAAGSARAAFVSRTAGLWSGAIGAFFAALAGLMVTLTLAGWGASFEGQALLPGWIGLVGCLSIAGGFVYVRSKAKAARVRGRRGVLGDGQRVTAEDLEDWVHHFSLQQTVVRGTGNQAVLASGFTFLTVVAFQDTLLGQPGTAQPWANLFLLANALAAMLAQLSVLYATQLQLWMDDLPTAQQKAYFARSARPLALFAGWALEGSLCSFLAGFALYGFARFTPTRFEPVVAGAIGLVVVLVVLVVVQLKYSEAEGIARHGPAGADGQRQRFAYPGFVSRLEAIGGACLVLGGFLYLSQHSAATLLGVDEGVTHSFTVVLELGLMLAIATSACATICIVRLKSLRADRQKEFLSQQLAGVGAMIYVCFLLTLLSAAAIPVLLGGGAQTLLAATTSTAVCLIAPTPVAVIVAIVALGRTLSLARKAADDVEAGRRSTSGEGALTVDGAHMHALSALSPLGGQAAFIAGSVLLEITTFAVPGPDEAVAAAYVALLAVTAALGVFALAAVAHVSTWVPYPEDEWARAWVLDSLRRGCLQVLPWAFHAVWAALLTWLAAGAVLGTAKWPASHSGGAELAPAIGACVVLVLVLGASISSRRQWRLARAGRWERRSRGGSASSGAAKRRSGGGGGGARSGAGAGRGKDEAAVTRHNPLAPAATTAGHVELM